MKRRIPSPALVVATFALVVALGTAAWAAVPGTGGMINACYNPHGGSLRVVGAGAKTSRQCASKRGEVPLSWNQTGPAGPVGPAGPSGPVGPAGAQGPQGATGPVGQPGANGSTILNGGGVPDSGKGSPGDFYVDTAADALYGPKTQSGWGNATSLIGKTGQPGPAGQISTYTTVNFLTTRTDDTATSVEATCNGSPLLGGGFDNVGDNSSVQVTASKPNEQDDAWDVWARTSDAEGHLVEVFAVCASQG